MIDDPILAENMRLRAAVAIRDRHRCPTCEVDAKAARQVAFSGNDPDEVRRAVPDPPAERDGPSLLVVFACGLVAGFVAGVVFALSMTTSFGGAA